MASSSFSQEDFSCPVCLGLFKNPVLLACSHSFCEACVRGSWEAKQSRPCPTCRQPSPTDEPAPNLVLKNLCEKFIQQRKAQAEMCKLHSNERVRFFCRDDKTPMCSVCRESEAHSCHRVRPIEKLTKKRKVVYGFHSCYAFCCWGVSKHTCTTHMSGQCTYKLI